MKYKKRKFAHNSRINEQMQCNTIYIYDFRVLDFRLVLFLVFIMKVKVSESSEYTIQKDYVYTCVYT